MHGIVLERDDDPADSAAGCHPVARLQAVDHFLPALLLALLKLKRCKDKKQGEQQEDAQAAAGVTALKQKITDRIVHHAMIAFTAARTLALMEWESYTLICDR
jgi:hypothetical protein